MTAPPGAKGALINFGTWQSAIYGFAMAHELKDLRKKLFPDRLPALKPRLTSRGVLHKSEEVKIGRFMNFEPINKGIAEGGAQWIILNNFVQFQRFLWF